MDDDALNARLDELLWSEHPKILARNAADYDGVMGQLPDWIPENFHNEFHAIRNRLLATYRHADLLTYIAEMRNKGMQGNRDAGEFAELVEIDGALKEKELGITPGGMFSEILRPRTPAPIWRDICILAQIQEAFQLGPVEGLALLTDTEHAKNANKGKAFTPKGRGQGTIRKWIKRQLAKNPKMKNALLWGAFKAKPLPGWQVMENRQGKYLEGKTADDHMTYGRFSNVAKEERDKLKG